MNIKQFYILFFFFCSLHKVDAQSIIINEYMALNGSSIEDFEGEANDWIEFYNNQNVVINLSNYSLSDDIDTPQKWIFPNIDIPANSYLLIWASGKDLLDANGEYHTNFKVSSSGEAIFLYNDNGQLIDETPSLDLDANISLGRTPDDLSNWYYFSEPTPSEVNTSFAFEEQAILPIISSTGGFYQSPEEIILIPNNPNDEIRYTLDGSSPNESSMLYVSPITISENTALRIKVYRLNALPSKVSTQSYLFDEDLNLGVVSLAIDPDHFFGSMGIYGNYTSGEERPVHLEYYEKDKTFGFKLDMGMKIHAPDNRPQKAMRLYARSEYGTSAINYKIFDDKNLTYFKTLILRNAGNDGAQSKRTHVKDPFVHKLYRDQNPENAEAAYEPVHVFLNGEYWGIYNLRERQDEHYIKSKFGYEKEMVDFIEYDYAEPGGKKTISGNWDDWEALKAFLLDEDFSDTTNYDIIKDWIDIENFIDYQIFNIVIGNQDWLNNNYKMWRPKTPEGKWKWLMWDTDYALGTQISYPVGQPEFDFVNMAIVWGGWGNGDHTWMLRNLLDNDVFKKQFVLRFTDLLNTTFQPDYMLDEFEKMILNIEPDMHKQFDKWGSSEPNWSAHIDHTNYFIENRMMYNRIHLADRLDLIPDLQTITLNVSDEAAGNILINSIFIDENTLAWQEQPYPWQGEYFEDYEIKVKAIPKPGYEFSHWEGNLNSEAAELTITLTEAMTLNAVFVPNNLEEIIPPLFINEISSKNESLFPDETGEYEDWIEIYNAGTETVDLAGLFISDDSSDPLKWQIPETNFNLTLIEPGGHLILFADKEPNEGVLHLDFKLNSDGEEVGIYMKEEDDGDIITIDLVAYTQQISDVSFGRLPDGAEEWILFNIPTPNATNEIISAINGLGSLSILEVFPNPTHDLLIIKSESKNNEIFFYEVLDVQGKVLKQGMMVSNIDQRVDFSNLPPSTYLLKVSSLDKEYYEVRKIIRQ